MPIPAPTEMPPVMSLDRVAGMRVVLGFLEGACTGADDGWARMTGRPATTLLHLGPGFANGIANLHNARRARHPSSTGSAITQPATCRSTRSSPRTSLR